jgi:hypothetical protein
MAKIDPLLQRVQELIAIGSQYVISLVSPAQRIAPFVARKLQRAGAVRQPAPRESTAQRFPNKGE